MIKTFRALITHEAQDTIVLHTNDGATGYRIVKFQIFPGDPGSQHYEATLKMYKVSQGTITNDVDFSDQTLLGAAYYQDDNAKHYASSDTVVFDNEIFNQDIFVTYFGTDSATSAMNYYIELEQVKLDLSESTVATLKNLKNLEPGG